MDMGDGMVVRTALITYAVFLLALAAVTYRSGLLADEHPGSDANSLLPELLALLIGTVTWAVGSAAVLVVLWRGRSRNRGRS